MNTFFQLYNRRFCIRGHRLIHRYHTGEFLGRVRAHQAFRTSLVCSLRFATGLNSNTRRTRLTLPDSQYSNESDSTIRAYFLKLFSFWQQGLVASVGAVMGMALIFYFFSTPMKEDTVHHTAAMASEALQDPNLRKRAIEFSKLVVQDILNDPNSLNLTVKLVTQLLAREDVKVAVSSLLQSLFEDRFTQEITKKFILALLRDRWVSDQLSDITTAQTHRLLENEEIKTAFANFIADAASETLQKPDIHDKSASAIRSTFIQVINPLKLLGKNSA